MKVLYICDALSWTSYINSISWLKYMRYSKPDDISSELLYVGYPIGIWLVFISQSRYDGVVPYIVDILI